MCHAVQRRLARLQVALAGDILLIAVPGDITSCCKVLQPTVGLLQGNVGIFAAQTLAICANNLIDHAATRLMSESHGFLSRLLRDICISNALNIKEKIKS